MSSLVFTRLYNVTEQADLIVMSYNKWDRDENRNNLYKHRNGMHFIKCVLSILNMADSRVIIANVTQ